MHIPAQDILPQPFDWITIPAGKVKILYDRNWKNLWKPDYRPDKFERTFDVAGFEIGKYPVTNAQFAKFVDAQGYHQREWWTDAGWKQRQQGGWTKPLYWHIPKWNKPDFPVVGVSWYEASAFCQWLSAATGENVRLPTEQEWQHAAQGESDRDVAWDGVNDEEMRCNWEGFWDTDGTTPVTQFEGKGDSPYGVVDMTGNVWEWCCNTYETDEANPEGTAIRVAPGGGWVLIYSYEVNIRVTDRMGLSPHHRLNYLGFRCAWS